LPCRGAKVTKFAVNIAKMVDVIEEFGVFEGNLYNFSVVNGFAIHN
jgi:hypothetical protein